MYISGFDVTTTLDLYQEVYTVYFHSQKMYNCLVDFSDGGEDRVPNYKRDISCVILCLFGVAVHWLSKTKRASASNSIYSEVHTF